MLISTSGFVNLYFHEIRGYSLFLLMAVVHVWLYWRLMSRKRTKGLTWVLFALSTGALLYTHIYSIFLLVALVVQHWLFELKARNGLGVLAGWALGGLTSLAYLPVWATGFTQVSSSGERQAAALSSGDVIMHVVYLLVNDMVILWIPILLLGLLTLRRKHEPSDICD